MTEESISLAHRLVGFIKNSEVKGCFGLPGGFSHGPTTLIGGKNNRGSLFPVFEPMGDLIRICMDSDAEVLGKHDRIIPLDISCRFITTYTDPIYISFLSERFSCPDNRETA